MSEKIDSALVQAFVAGSFSLSVAYENDGFNPVTGTPYAELFVLHNQPSVNTLGDGGQDLIDGIMQININYPLDDGSGNAKVKATAIRDFFVAGSRFTFSGQEVFITSAGRNGSGRREGNWYQIIITIQWEARVTR